VNGKSENQFTQFRLQLYHQHFNKRDDTLMELVDAICSGLPVRSVVEYSLSPCFRRNYNSLYKGIQDYQPQKAKLNQSQLAAPYLPQPQKRPFWLLGLDVTPCPRIYAFKLEGRECVYQPNPVRGSKQITYGHQYSDAFLLPERESANAPRWVIPLDDQRVRREDQEKTGIRQVHTLLEAAHLPFDKELCVLVGDCKYSTPTFLDANSDKPNLILIVRARGNRHFSYRAKVSKIGRGHPIWYEEQPFSLKDPLTWPQPDEALSILATNSRGRPNRTEIMAWHNLVMRGKCKLAIIPMQDNPFTLVRIVLYNERNEPVFKKPLWLIVMGRERHNLSLINIHEAYRQRSDMEHFFRFAKRQMLLDSYQTSETEHEENWWKLVHLAYLQLWVAKKYACCLPHPWQRYLPQVKARHLSPTMVQRSFEGIIRQFGTPARSPKPRGNSPGRLKGMVMALKKDQPLIHRCRN
jgi:hypothetical protein